MMDKETFRKACAICGVCKLPKSGLTEAERLANQNRVLRILRGIENRKGIEDLIQYLGQSRFFTMGCHTHHRYRGGLAEHSLEVYDAAMKICKDTPQDSIAIAALLHDLGDVEYGGGKMSVEILREMCFRLTPQEERAIRFHMLHRRSEDEMLEFQQAMKEELWRAITGSDCFSAGGYRNGLEKIVEVVIAWGREYLEK